MVAHLDAMLARYDAGEPLAYVLGRWAFRRLDLFVDRRVLIPRPETEVVAGVALELARRVPAPDRRRRPRHRFGRHRPGAGRRAAGRRRRGVADRRRRRRAGRGPGQPGRHRAAGGQRPHRRRSLVRRPARRTCASTWSWPTRRTWPRVAGRGRSRCAQWEPHHALFAGPDGLDAIRELVAGAPARLRPGGWLVLEIGADQGAAVADLLSAAGYADVEIRPDLAGRDRVAIAGSAGYVPPDRASSRSGRRSR